MAKFTGTPGGMAGFINQLLGTGVSANRGLQSFREAGGSVRRATWLSTWGEVRAGMGNRERLSGLAMDVLPDDSVFTDWSAGRRGTVATHIDLLVREKGVDEPYRRNYTLISEGPMTPEDAIARAIDEFESATAEGGTGEGEEVLGGLLSGLFRMTGR